MPQSTSDPNDPRVNSAVPDGILSRIDHPTNKALLAILQRIDLRRLINEIMPTLSNGRFYAGLFNAIKAHIEAHPYATAFLVIGFVLMINPLALAGFGALGPVAGSLAAAWQASIGGTVVAGSAFAILQSLGMTFATAIPVTGTIISAASVVVPAAAETFSNLVAQWWNNVYNSSVTLWWRMIGMPARRLE